MKLKNTIFLLALALALIIFIRFYESNQLTSQEAKERADRVVSFDRDKVDAITIKNSEGKIELRRGEGGQWSLTEPVKDRADTLAISQLFTTAESLHHDAVIGNEKKGAERDELKEYGLTNSETKLKLAGKERTFELLIGKDAAVEGKVYVKVGGENPVYVVGKDLKDQISKKVDDFRDRKLTDVNTARVNKVTIKSAAGEIELEKKDLHWSLMKPLRARGDDARIGDLVSQAATARIEAFIRDAANPSAYGLQEPRATISLWSEDEARASVLELGAHAKDTDKDKVYAKSSSRDGVVLLSQTIDNLIDTKPNDLRDKNLVRVEADIVDRLTIEGQGKEKIVLARKGESWVRKVGASDLEIDVAAARRALDAVRTQPVSAFVSDVAADLGKYGLDQPRLKVTLSSYASENTAETKAGDKPIAAVLFGKVEDGNVYARVEDEPFIVSVPQTLLEALMTDPLQWQPLQIFRAKAEEISSIEVIHQGQPLLSLERDRAGKWKLAKGDGAVNQINAESLANTLATLRAVRWAGTATPADALDKPALTLSFKTAGNVSGKLTVGGDLSRDFPRASASGLNGVFELSRPDLSALELPLLDKPAASPAATIAPTVRASQAEPLAPSSTEAPLQPAPPQP